MFNCKTKTKNRSAVVPLSYVPPPETGKNKISILLISKINTSQRAINQSINQTLCELLHTCHTSEC